MGIQMLPPDVNCSALGFQPETHSIRFGLGSIKKVGKSAAQSILAARQQHGRSSDLEQFCRRTQPNRSVLESLIKSGSLDSFGWTRAQMMARLAARREGSKASLKQPKPWTSQSVPEWPQAERLAGEKEVLGFYVTGHPLENFRSQIAEVTNNNSTSLHELSNHSPVTLAGLLTQFKAGISRRNTVWAKGVLEDLHGSADLLVFGHSVPAFQGIDPDTVIVVSGTILKEDGQRVKVVAKEVIELNKIATVLITTSMPTCSRIE
jgi:DNA polymerase III subunit alpha